jgi:type II secretory pathway pseudopilin PulG
MWPGKAQRGFTLVAVLAAMFLLALASQGVMTVVSQEVQRECEAELIRIGTAYAEAIRSYYESTPGSIKRWPRTLDELADDKRFVTTRRHIREAYGDPLMRSGAWGIVTAPDGGIAGVYSRSEEAPIRAVPPEAATVAAQGPARYADWQFAYLGAPAAGQER